MPIADTPNLNFVDMPIERMPDHHFSDIFMKHPLRLTPEIRISQVSAMDHTPDIHTCQLSSTDNDVLAQIREVTSCPTPLTEFLHDPLVIDKLIRTSPRPRTKHRRGSSTASTAQQHNDNETRPRRGTGQESQNRHHDKEASLVSLVLAESERQVAYLQSMLRAIGDKLSSEMHRATQAETRMANTTARLNAAEAARHQADLDALRWKDDCKRRENETDTMEQELRRVKADIRTLERQRYEAEAEASMYREEATKYQLALKDYQAREDGKDLGHRLAMQKWFDEGKEEGWEAGYDEGYEEGQDTGYKKGFKAGREEGFQSGRRQGRDDERQNALDAFDRFLVTEMQSHRENEHRIRQWQATTY